MSSFLQEVAIDLINKYGQELSDCTVVFPSRRAGVFFKSYLYQSSPKVMWSPKISTINEIMQEFSGLQVADSLSMIFELYKVYLAEKKSHESFDDFYFWGTVMLNDFDEIDKYKIDAKSLFSNLAANKNFALQFDFLTDEQKEIIGKFWDSFTRGKVSSHQENFLRNWDILFSVYNNFRNRLRTVGKGYEGMIYRDLAELCEQGKCPDISYRKIVFVGFNALNKCEKIFFKWLKNIGKADFYWDSDPYYFDNQKHEGGKFLRENIKEFDGWKSDASGMNGNKKISFLSVSSNIAQAKLTGQFLESLSAVAEAEELKIAVVLPDEELLIPVLSAIPERFTKVNVTMGLRLKDSPVYELINQLVNLQANLTVKEGQLAFYYKSVLALLENPVFSDSAKISAQIRLDIKKRNMIFVKDDLITGHNLIEEVFQKIEGNEKLCNYLIKVLKLIALESHLPSKANLNSEFIYYACLSLQRLRDLLIVNNIELKHETFSRALKKIMDEVEVPFQGEPLAGIQVMGVLETRLLDFDHLLILSLNEGVFPRKNSEISFIPQNLRRGFGLPSAGHHDAIYSYYFFRMIQRVKQVTCVYNTQSGGMKSGEPSRFIYQLKYSGKFNLDYANLNVNATSGKVKRILVKKDSNIMEVLDTFLVENNPVENKSLSPSAINTWLQCKLKFYFRVIAGLKEPDDLQEEVDARQFGNLFHKTAEMVYKQFEGKILSQNDFTEIENDKFFKKIVLKAFNQVYFKNPNSTSEVILTGRNLIVADILQTYLKQVIKLDSKAEDLKIVALEKKVTGRIPIETRGREAMVRIGGIIDRIDETSGFYRIIDYKTGGDSMSVRVPTDLFKQGNKYGSILQMLIYMLLVKQEVNSEKLIIPGIYKVQSIFDKKFDFKLKIADKPFTGQQEITDLIYEELRKVLSEIFNPEIHFDQVNKTEICQYCTYKSICFPGRNKQFAEDIE